MPPIGCEMIDGMGSFVIEPKIVSLWHPFGLIPKIIRCAMFGTVAIHALVNWAMFPMPDDAKPMDTLVLVQKNCVPGRFVKNVIAVLISSQHTT